MRYWHTDEQPFAAATEERYKKGENRSNDAFGVVISVFAAALTEEGALTTSSANTT
jgi:hypothetical protein